MFNALLYIGLCVTAFAFFPGADLRELKMASAIAFGTALCMAEIFSHGIKKNKNIWVMLLLAYLPISIVMAPAPEIQLVGINVKGFWAWQPFLKIFIFVMLFFCISGHAFKPSQIRKILCVMVWCGFLTSIYEITQLLFTDQFFIRCADGDWGRIAGFIGNPTLTAPFVAMLVPLALYMKKNVMAAVMVIGAIIPDSQMAWVSLISGIAIYYALKGPKWFVSIAIGFALATVVFAGLYATNKNVSNKFNDHERYIQWKQIVKDWTGPLAPDEGLMNNYSMTGRGLGSFQYVYHIQNINVGSPNRFHQAHNDYIEFGYSVGFIGIGLLLMAAYDVMKRGFLFVWKNHGNVFSYGDTRYTRAMLSSFASISVAAIGSFVFQVGTTAFYTIVIVGLLYNQGTNKEFSI